MRQDAAFQESVELVFDKLRQVGAGSVFGLGEESRGMLLHPRIGGHRLRLMDGVPPPAPWRLPVLSRVRSRTRSFLTSPR